MPNSERTCGNCAEFERCRDGLLIDYAVDLNPDWTWTDKEPCPYEWTPRKEGEDDAER